METATYLSRADLDAGLDHIRLSPRDGGSLRMIVQRAQENHRESLATGELNKDVGLIGDNWKDRPSRHMPDRSPNPLAQITLMNSRVIALLAQTEERWSLAGDQLYVDLDLSEENLPPGARLALGSAVIEITAQPHSGCKKFSERFGVEAHKFVNSAEGKLLRLRGVNARVMKNGTVRVGEAVWKISAHQHR